MIKLELSSEYSYFGKVVSATELDHFLLLTTLIEPDNDDYDLLILNNEMYQHLEDVHNSVSLYFSSDQ